MKTNMKQNNPFQVPDSYFDSLGDKILQRIQDEGLEQEEVGMIEPKAKGRKIWLLSSIGIAASFLLIFGLFKFFQTEKSPTYLVGEEEVYDELYELYAEDEDVYSGDDVFGATVYEEIVYGGGAY